MALGHPVARVQPNAPPAILDILLDDGPRPPRTLLPARGDVVALGHPAEIGVEQVMATHHGKARVDDTALAFLDAVDSGLHVVPQGDFLRGIIDAAAQNATQCGEGTRMRIEWH